jgi:cytoskeletal protein CcmA (bactofilin family)
MLGKNRSSDGALTLIAPNAQIVGDVHFTGEMHIEGKVNGNLIAEGSARLVIQGGGLVEGEIRAPHVVVNGEVRGDVHAAERLELAARAVITGNVHYRLLEVTVGARIDGQLRHMAAPENT